MSRRSIVENFRKYLFHTCRVPRGSRILVGLSGGPDSVALLALLRDSADLEIGAAHLDHGLRGAESDRDAAFVRALCSDLGVPLRLRSLAVGLLDPTGPDLEARARGERLSFLEESRREGPYDYIALGHHRDDQAETVLMALFRGSGPPGLAGIPPRRGRIVRPLLGLGRADLLEYLEAVGLDFVEDSTNVELDATRNRIRLDLIPRIERDYNPRIVNLLARTADLLAEEDRYLDKLAARLLRSESRYIGFGDDPGPRRIALGNGFFDQPKALVRRALRLAYRLVRGSLVDLTFDHVEGLLEPAAVPGGSGLSLPGGIRARNVAGEVIIEEALEGTSRLRHPHAVLPVPGVLILPRGIRIEARILGEGASRSVLDAVTDGRVPLLVSHAFIDYNKVDLPIQVRSWRPGDRMRPLGMSGHRKIQDIFVDEKVPRNVRSHVPLVLDRDHRVLWVSGIRLSDDGKLDGDTERVLHLRICGSASE